MLARTATADRHHTAFDHLKRARRGQPQLVRRPFVLVATARRLHLGARAGARRCVLSIVCAALVFVGCGGGADPPPERASEPTATATAGSATAGVGKKVDVGGRSLWLVCAGTGSPTVVLLHGQGQDLSTMTDIQTTISKETRTCSYDRAGQGRSDVGPRPQTVQHVVDELFALLHTAEVEPPYVLVGHSLGGPIAWTAATEHPDEVAAFLAMNSVPGAHDYLPRILPRFSREERRKERAYYRGENDEEIDLIASDAKLNGRRPPDDMPYIIMHGTDCQGDDLCSRTEDVALRLNRGLARASGRGRLLTVDAGHEIYLDQPAAVTGAISDLLDAASR